MSWLYSKQYRTEIPETAQQARHYSGCATLLLLGAMILAGVLYWRVNRPAEDTPVVGPPTVQLTPQPSERSVVSARHDCTAINAACGSISRQPTDHVIERAEAAALTVIYPTGQPIPEGVDSACYWANYYAVPCADVQAATKQMRGDK